MTTITRPGVGQRTAHDPGDPLVTSHCPFCGSGQVVGRSDGTIGCDFCGQSYIVRVQPAFPGMPQMPMGPGAPSDVGPDGGLMDPGMIGPDGMPADDGGPPPADAEAEDGPIGEPPGDEAEPPDGDEDDATGSAPPPKGGKGKSGPPKAKKSGSRRYRGLEGQSLTEDQLLRHIAVRASGGDPRVLAVLRREAATRRTAITGTVPYRTLSTGHQVSIGRHGRDWYGLITHPETSQIHVMHVGDRPDYREEIERQLGRDNATRSFIHATSPATGQAPAMPVREPPGQWYRGTGPGHAPSDWRPAQASRRPFGQGKTGAHEWHNHGDMSPHELRAHMWHHHGYWDSPDDPDWLIDETHRNEHADAPLEHSHPDLAGEWEEGVLPIEDRDWLGHHGIEGSRRRRPFAAPRTTARTSAT